MKSILKLFFCDFKTYLRDKQALFWTIFFPVMFVFLFGLFNFEKMGTSHMAVIDQAKSDESSKFIKGLKKVEILKIHQDEEDVTRAKEKLERGDLDFVLIIPKSFRKPGKKPLRAENYKRVAEKPKSLSIPIEVYYDEANTQLNPLVFGVLNQFVTYSNLKTAGAPELFSLDKKPVKSRNIRYLDILVPGILAMAIMTSAVTGMSADIAESREKKILKRLFVTPLKTSHFLIAQIGVFLTISLIQVAIILFVSVFAFKVNILGSYFLIFLVALFGCALFLNIGFIIAGLVKSTRAVEAVANVTTIPMMFLSGVFFPKEIMPKIMASVVDYLPLTPLVDALRKISIDEAGLFDLGREFLFLGVWFFILLIIAIKTFRFKEE
jgi:ABC-2 type transport system permease protein